MRSLSQGIKLFKILCPAKEGSKIMSKEDRKIIEQISHILVREKQISSEEQLRMLGLLRKEKQSE